jgi:hypothetical protein
MSKKKFVIRDREFDNVGDYAGYDSKAEAIEAARASLSDGNRYHPLTIYEAVAQVGPAQTPVTVVDL